VTVIPDGEVECKHLFVRLLWRTEGRGTRYLEKVAELDVFQGTLQGSFPRAYEFSFPLLDDPWSYEGFYVSIVWAIAVQVDVSWAKDPQGAESFILSPDRGAEKQATETDDWGGDDVKSDDWSGDNMEKFG